MGLVPPGLARPGGPRGVDSHPPCAPQELKLKDEECERLSKVREQLEQELEELTASLFEVPGHVGQAGEWVCWPSISSSPRMRTLLSSQEAHKMVREANMKQAASEKQLKEARGKVRVPPPRPLRTGLHYPVGPSQGLVGPAGMGELRPRRWRRGVRDDTAETRPTGV